MILDCKQLTECNWDSDQTWPLPGSQAPPLSVPHPSQQLGDIACSLREPQRAGEGGGVPPLPCQQPTARTNIADHDLQKERAGRDLRVQVLRSQGGPGEPGPGMATNHSIYVLFRTLCTFHSFLPNYSMFLPVMKGFLKQGHSRVHPWWLWKSKSKKVA